MRLVTDNYIKEFCNAVNNAQRYVYINSYTISPPIPSLGLRFASAWEAVFAAVRRGVEVRVLVDGGVESKMLLLGLLRFFKFEMPAGILVKVLGLGKKLHAKFYIIDDTIFCVGSHNFTKRGLSNPYELSLLCRDNDVATRLKTYFLSMWSVAYVYKKPECAD